MIGNPARMLARGLCVLGENCRARIDSPIVCGNYDWSEQPNLIEHFSEQKCLKMRAKWRSVFLILGARNRDEGAGNARFEAVADTAIRTE